MLILTLDIIISAFSLDLVKICLQSVIVDVVYECYLMRFDENVCR